MKKLLIFSLLSFFFLTNSIAQELSTKKSKNSFIELNGGVAFLSEFGGIPFPGISVLWGTTYINEDNLIFEYEVGFAFPTIVTGKIGVGKRFNNTNIVLGVRPWPLNLYTQASFSDTKNGYWITSIEFNPSNTNFSIGSRALLNFGYRWNLTITKKKIEIEL
jgi:hypothetical protein